MQQVLCLGSITADVIVRPADSIPTPGTLRRVESITSHVGGCASNAAIDLAKLGIPSMLCCRIGEDGFGRMVRETAEAAGVDTRGVVSCGGVGTTVSVVCVSSDGERSFLYEPGSTSAFVREDIPERLTEECGVVFVAGAMILSSFDGAPCAEFLKRMQGAGKYTAMDTAWDFDGVWLPKLRESIRYLDLFLPSYDEAEKLAGVKEPERMAEYFRELGAKNVIIKLGGDGAYLLEEGGKGCYLPAYTGVRVKDTTGAGDAFCAGFLAGLAQGLPFLECGRLANAVGCHCVTEVGASTGIRPLSEILEFMNRHEDPRRRDSH